MSSTLTALLNPLLVSLLADHHETHGAPQAHEGAADAFVRGTSPETSGSSILDGAFLQVFGVEPGGVGEFFCAILAMLVACLAVFGFINIFALFAVWLERKVSAHMRCRLGPMEVGPHGALQTIADGIKLTVKEDIIPRVADKPLFIIAPIIVFAGTLIRFVPLPFGDKLIASDMNLGLFFIGAVLGGGMMFQHNSLAVRVQHPPVFRRILFNNRKKWDDNNHSTQSALLCMRQGKPHS